MLAEVPHTHKGPQGSRSWSLTWKKSVLFNNAYKTLALVQYYLTYYFATFFGAKIRCLWSMDNIFAHCPYLALSDIFLVQKNSLVIFADSPQRCYPLAAKIFKIKDGSKRMFLWGRGSGICSADFTASCWSHWDSTPWVIVFLVLSPTSQSYLTLSWINLTKLYF